ncbi:DUF7343 domain-containing protein [Haloferax marisrubri]|uniref:DUF7343 domain-containing protein n=1 Tax=Haloferax marisrubri TaxID=1544719 RepID=A0A2P4NNE1_9EURY|nr:hypothetical protein [Haloferax marisrubri]POG54598.1 hypothetical protein AUR65_012745 [Haloferax marisrubri]
MTIRTGGHRTSRTLLVAVVLALVVATAGCVGDGEGPGEESNTTTQEQVTEPLTDDPTVTEEPTDAPTEEPTATEAPTDEPTEAPTETETPGGGEGGDSGGDESNGQTLLLLGALAVFAVGFVAAGILRGRNKSSSPEASTAPTAATADSRSDAERVVSLLHKNNGRMFEDVLEEELDWSPAHARRVVDGLVATGDVERRETEGGTLVVFADPDRPTDAE